MLCPEIADDFSSQNLFSFNLLMIFKKFYLGRIFSFAFGAIAKRVFTNDCYNVKVIH